MDRAAVGKTELVMDLGDIGDDDTERRAFLRANEKAMVFYTAVRYDSDGLFRGWRNYKAYVLNVQKGKCPVCLGDVGGYHTSTYESDGLRLLYGRVNDPQIDRVELWWWDRDENGETCGGVALRIDRSEFLYRDGENYLLWKGQLPPFQRIYLKCYDKEDKLLLQEEIWRCAIH